MMLMLRQKAPEIRYLQLQDSLPKATRMQGVAEAEFDTVPGKLALG